MTSKVDKSLEEVWEMKVAAQKAFEDSGFDNYLDFIKSEIKEIEEKHHFKVSYYQQDEIYNLKSA